MLSIETRDCPVASECASCGRRRKLTVREVETDAGAACVTVCESCADRGELPPVSPFVAPMCVEAHRAHLGLAGVRS
ncbi:hypothetical protein B0I28_10610 [Glycomyces artemisiae]|uniref:Uncharacterized protein n=1 Tax=Glycomyces artemisiae TaxID=1076443 RepID=A0A2T0UI28_9ACTN|nr:hypothetical protein B0I28_10610 [Glycomyces artemisiae]